MITEILQSSSLNPTMRQRVVRALSCFVAVFLITAGSAFGQNPKAGSLEAELNTMVPALLKEQGVPGVSIAFIKGGQVVLTRAYGLADTSKGTPVRPETRFNVGSVSKTLTAWGVMALVDRGLVDLNAPVDRYLKRWHLPKSNFDNNNVTVRLLLSHTAGLSLYPMGSTVDPSGLFHPGEKMPALEDALSRSRGNYGVLRVAEEPGQRFQYNNGDYVVLQLLIEDVTGRRFDDYMRQVIFKPLGVTRTGYVWTSELAANVATPYNPAGDRVPQYLGPEQASGGAFTTAADLARFVSAAMAGPQGQPPGRGMLKPETVLQMFTPAEKTDGAYGLGYKMFPVSKDVQLITHDGANEGWRAMFLMDPHKGDGIVILTNSDLGGKIVAPIVCVWSERAAIDMSPLCRSVSR